MKAIVVREFGAPDVMKLENVPEPVPGPGQVTIRVHAVGVNPVDTYIRAGAYARKPNLPYSPGTDVGGTVHAIGASVTRVKVGDRVYGTAPSADTREIALCEDWQVHRLPERILVRAGRGDRRSVCDRVAGAVHARAGAAGRNSARARRERRRRHRGGSDRARARPARHRHGGHARKAWRSFAAGRAPRAQPSRRRLPAAVLPLTGGPALTSSSRCSPT